MVALAAIILILKEAMTTTVKVKTATPGVKLAVELDFSQLTVDGCSRKVGERGVEVTFAENVTVRFNHAKDPAAIEVFDRHDRTGFVDYHKLEKLMQAGRLGKPELSFVAVTLPKSDSRRLVVK